MGPTVQVPSSVPLIARRRLVALLGAVVVVWLPGIVGRTPPAGAAALTASYPTAPPARICGNAAVLDGPAVQPAGSVRVDPWLNLGTLTLTLPAGTTFWLAPGVHSLGTLAFSQVLPKTDNVYIGAPGAVIDGQGVNRYAFTGLATGVRISNLTIRNFVSPPNEGVVNHDSGLRWTIEFSTIAGNAGAGVMLGTDSVVRSNCLADNGQYGFSAYSPGGGRNITLDRNEIKGNNTYNWEVVSPGCGCSGAGKFWNTAGAVVTNNWVHHNRGVGLWIDTNNVGFRIEGNYIEANDDEGIFYETSYNARIANNTLVRNAIVKGKTFAAQGQNTPVGAIYISESGGDPRVNGGVYTTMEIAGNFFDDNWSGVVLWENADRFCGSPANTSISFCTLGGAATLQTCVAGTIGTAPYFSDCRWKTQNVSVHDNVMHFSRANVGCTTQYCGLESLYSNFGTFPSWSPYQQRVVQDAITFDQNNRHANNSYVGDWQFMAYEGGTIRSFSDWQSAFGQDAGSTFVPGTGFPAPVPGTNVLDAGTAGAEDSAGQWGPWFSAGVSSSAESAHSGTRSLKVDITAPNGWGLQLKNWPGFVTAPGPQTIGFWARTPAGACMSITMSVHWRTAAGAELRTDVVTLPLSTTWAQARASVIAPPGTERVFLSLSNSSGPAGSTIFVDDVIVADGAGTPPAPPIATNDLDADSAGLEGSVGQWGPWVSAGVSSTSEEAHTGARSLKVAVNAPHGWGVQLRNWPGFNAGAGPKTIAMWAKTTSGPCLSVAMVVHWRNEAATELRTDTLTLPLTSSWARVSAAVTAPAGTTKVSIDLLSNTGVAGTAIFVDDIEVGTSIVAPATTTTSTVPSTTTTVPPTTTTVPPTTTTVPPTTTTSSTTTTVPPTTTTLPPTTTTLPPTTTTTAPAATTTTTTTLPAASNALDAATASMEGSVGYWASWFSANVSSSTEQAHTGASSLKVAVTAPYGWGIAQTNWPGFATGSGAKTIGFWAKTTSGAGLSAAMAVQWRNALGITLQTDIVSVSLSGSWAQTLAYVTAPAGTARVSVNLTNTSGTAGSTIFVDDVMVGATVGSPPAPAGINALDANTAGIEGSVGQWAPWFSSNISSSNESAHSGTRSLKVAVTAPNGWGAQLQNWPGFVASEGARTISLSARASAGLGLAVTVAVGWRTETGATLRTDIFTLPLGTTWGQLTASVMAPPGTARVSIDLSNSSGIAGTAIYVDDVAIRS